MKALRLAAALLILGCGAQPVESAASPRKTQQLPPKMGDVAPDFTLTDQSGRQVTLSDARGQNAILVFYRGYW